MEEHRKPAGYSCKSCTRPDTDDEKWVACDRCKLWEHFECAGVNESVKSRRYVCKECELTVAVPTASTSRGLKPPPSEGRSLRSSTAKSGLKPVNKVTTLASKFSRSANSTTSSTRARLEAQMKLAEEEQVLKEQELEAQEAMRRKEMEEEERRLEEKKALLKEEARLRQRKLQEEKEYQKKQQLIRMESLEKRNTIARQMSVCSSKSESIPDSEQQIALWLQQCSPEPFEDRFSSLRIDAEEEVQHLSYQRPRTNQDCQEAMLSVCDSIENQANQQANQDVFRSRFNCQTPLPLQNDRASVTRTEHGRLRDASMPYQQNPGSRQPRAYQPEEAAFPVTPSPSQLAARQVMGKELPNFTGNPEDWPIFICSFEQSTVACGYSNAENLMRLQRCLKGQALESVRSRLLLPSSVPQVINTLRTLYGRPELLIRTLIEKVRLAAAPRHDRLESVVEFGLVVQNLVDHLKAAKQYTHLSNPVLMQELVEKLPGSLKLDWAVYRSRQPYATLATFGDFMTGLLDAASQVTYELPNASRNFRGEQRRVKEKGLLNAHSSTPASETSNLSPNLKRAGSIYRRGARRWRKLYRINGHIFQAKRFNRKAFCAFCHDRIWGLGRQGFKCIQCKLLVHKKCHKLGNKPCSNEHVEPVYKERDHQDLNDESSTGDVIQPPQDYPSEYIHSDPSCDQVPVEASDNVEEPLEPGTQRQYSLNDFELIRVIGRGSYAKVLMVELKKTRRIYAMKVIKKALVTDDEDIDWVQTEKHVFETASNHPFLVGLHSCFQTPSRLFFVIEFVRGGDLMFHMQRQRRLPEEHARFYAAEISLALNFLHEKGIIYRDLKLDNVLLDHEGHIKLTDYGMCKEGIRPGDTTSTFCGTPNYIAPEILRGEDYGFSVDWWALGVLLYEMLAGRSPFDIAGASENPDQNTEDYLFQVILEKTIRIPRSLSVKAASVLKGFLNKNPADRLGCNRNAAFMDIVNHPFFKSIDWEALEQKQITPPFRPRLESDRDLANFPPEFTDEPVHLTPDDDRVIDKIDQSEFEGFEYVNPLLMSLEDCV